MQSPSWEANWFAASQEIPRISRNPNVHYRTHMRPPTFSILGQPISVHKPPSHLLEIHPNIIHPSTPMSPQWTLSLRFPHQDPNTPSPHPYALHAQPISFFSILSPAHYWVRSTNHLAPRYANVRALNSRRTRRSGQVACMKEWEINSVYWRTLSATAQLEDTGLEGRIMLDWKNKEYLASTWIWT